MRTLGYIESIYYILSIYCNIPCNVVCLIEFDQSISMVQIHASLKRAFARFILLQCKIREINGLPHFITGVKFSQIPIQTNHFIFDTIANWSEILDCETNDKWT
jgi:hypothetical protein